ncbi:MAG: hypothetical protein ABI841_01705 [Chloroflexota bacterium]
MQRAVVFGAAIAGVLWGASGVVAVLDPVPDPGPPGSSSFYLIEGSHALSETAMAVALVGLWRTQVRRVGRLASVFFGLAVSATVLLALLTYIVVIGTTLGLGLEMPGAGEAPPAVLVVLATVFFVVTFVGLVAGYVGAGLATVRSGVWPSLTGWPLVAHPFLLFANLVVYPIGIVIGILWVALASVARRATFGAEAAPDVRASP